MPELPEVETIVRHLNADGVGMSITKVVCRLKRIYEGPLACVNLSRRLKGKSIETIKRRGKYIIIFFRQAPEVLIVHLGMSGQLILSQFPTAKSSRSLLPHEAFKTLTGLKVFRPGLSLPLDKHCHFTIQFKKNALIFRDPRTFGKIILSNNNWEEHPRIKKLGAEPLAISTAKIYQHWPKTSLRTVKALLLDQSILAGVGNIYADEALFRAGLHPQTRGDRLTEMDGKTLIRAVKYVLRKGIKNFGTTFSNFTDPSGAPGKNYQYLKVYGRGGLPCRRCGATLKKTF